MSYWSERYYRLKEQGLCVCCGEKAVEGKTRCEFCSGKARLLYKESITREKQDKLNAIHRNRYHELREKGLCVWCGKPVQEGKALCEVCAEKKREQSAKSRRKKWVK